MKNAPIDKETTEKKTAARIHPASEHLSSKAIRKVNGSHLKKILAGGLQLQI
jgi:hypothetical protein